MGRADNRLLVEGDEDKRVIPELIERAGIPWGPRGSEIVSVHEVGGYSRLAEEFRPQLKSAGLQRLGILVDANADPAARWTSLGETVATECVLPAAPAPTGFIEPKTRSGLRLGIWMMPDNSSHGMLETFLLALRPTTQAPLLAHAEQAVDAAKQFGAPFSAEHRDKSLIHTWLSWQEPPGRQLHQALIERMLDPTGPYAAAFVAWFRALFELP